MTLTKKLKECDVSFIIALKDGWGKGYCLSFSNRRNCGSEGFFIQY